MRILLKYCSRGQQGTSPRATGNISPSSFLPLLLMFSLYSPEPLNKFLRQNHFLKKYAHFLILSKMPSLLMVPRETNKNAETSRNKFSSKSIAGI
jgi:hypothetical protein